MLVTGYDADKKPVKDATQKSYSSTFFLAQKGNNYAEKSSMLLTDANGLGSAYMPQSGSPLLNAADFTTAPAAFDKVNFIGAISPAANRAIPHAPPSPAVSMTEIGVLLSAANIL